MTRLSNLKKELLSLGSPQKSKDSAIYFKTGPGQYGEGDIFIGITVPEQRKIAPKYKDISLEDVEKLLRCKEHEFRATALKILVGQYQKADEKTKKEIFDLYLRNTKWINNWDLVDTSAAYIVGDYLEHKSKSILPGLARSASLWERRISIIATFDYIQKGNPEETFQIAEILLNDRHDLIHKAVGWMLREAGKRCGQKAEEDFLKKHYKTMPRTMLRYSIERFSPETRLKYLKGKI